MLTILPAVLAHTEAECKAHLFHHGLRAVAPLWHVDILDGSMFNATCWADPSVIGTWENLPDIELHIMTHNPLPVIEAWQRHVATLRRVIFHAEVARPLGAIIERAKGMGLEAGLALNPETRLERIEHHLHDLHVVQMMGVSPGASGRPFMGDSVLAKIARSRSLFPQLPVSVDGGVNAENIRAISDAGAERVACSSALWSAANPEDAYEKLQSLLS